MEAENPFLLRKFERSFIHKEDYFFLLFHAFLQSNENAFGRNHDRA
jgi:hypothetical protein